ncbi:MAG TPA: YHS domain-containing protein [Candidatus Limnocylindrales bacterium]
MAEHRTIASNEDPVCGMTVDAAAAREKGLVREYEGREYVFCGKGCYLEFGDDPEAFLAEGFTPSM